MPSPFPGMNPYLEAPHIWEDFHASLAGEIRNQLIPHLRPRYFAALIPRVTYDEIFVQSQPYAIQPDVSVYRVNEPVAAAPAFSTGDPAGRPNPPPPLIGEVPLVVEVNLYSVEVREVETGRLVTAIEILSPVNKRPGHEALEDYQRKRRALLRSAAHLLEIDLLRAGRRWPVVAPLPDAPYFVFLSREYRRPKV
ncbi:MAG: DUF4058 family protein, partial [Chloroflexi bacterium]|nr:DUF4058 family protein [Chloroflexota bacterium]